MRMMQLTDGSYVYVKIDPEQYLEMSMMHAKDEITTAEWQEYCANVLWIIVFHNKDILVRLKSK